MKGKFFPDWERMTVREIREYLKGRQSVIVPMGITEQHGYHLPLATDTLNARGIAFRVGQRIDTIVAPAINMSFSGGQLPGTINIQPNVVGLLTAEVFRSLVAQGFRNVFLILGHGGSENLRALNDSLKGLLRDDPAFRNVMVVFAPVWRFHPDWKEAFREGDWHAGWLETSVMMALAPDLVQMDQLTLDDPELVRQMREHPDRFQHPKKPVDHETVVPRMGQRPEVKVGVMGDPKRASLERGRKIVEETVESMSELFLDLEKRRTQDYQDVNWEPEPIIL